MPLYARRSETFEKKKYARQQKISLFRCHACGSHEAHEEQVSEVFQIEGRTILVENIPALVCNRCEDAIFSKETTEKIRRMVHMEKINRSELCRWRSLRIHELLIPEETKTHPHPGAFLILK